MRRHQSPSPPKPHSGGIASGAGSQTWPQSPHPPAILTLCLQPKSSPFLRDYSIQLARIRPGLFVPADGGRGRDQGPVRILAYRTEARTSAFQQLAREESLVSNRSGMAEIFQGVLRIDISESRQPVRSQTAMFRRSSLAGQEPEPATGRECHAWFGEFRPELFSAERPGEQNLLRAALRRRKLCPPRVVARTPPGGTGVCGGTRSRSCHQGRHRSSCRD